MLPTTRPAAPNPNEPTMCSPDLRDYPLAVVEARANYHQPTDGMRAAAGLRPDPGTVLRLRPERQTHLRIRLHHGPRARGRDIPEPDGLAANRLRAFKGLDPSYEDKLLVPSHTGDKVPRYYQQIAINRATRA